MKEATIQMAVECVKLCNLLGVPMPNLLSYEETERFLEVYTQKLEEKLEELNKEYDRNNHGNRKYSYTAKDYATREFKALMKKCRKSMGVYFLFNKGKLVYIGKSKQLGYRILGSITAKTRDGHYIDEVRFILSPTYYEMNMMERLLIAKYQPILNDYYMNADEYSKKNLRLVNPYDGERHIIFGNNHPLNRTA
jgi:hypothetical protein